MAKSGCRDGLDLHFFGDGDADDLMMFRRNREVCVDENFKHGARIALRGIDNAMAGGVPARTVEHGACAIVDGVPGVGDTVRDHC